jgi:hypothetical protein
MRVLIEFLFGKIIKEIAITKSEEMLEGMIEDLASTMRDDLHAEVMEYRGFVEDIESRVENLEDGLSEVETTAEEALSLSGANQEQIDEIESRNNE